MTPLEFLRLVWPTDGYYCLATPFKLPQMKKATYAHKVFNNIEDAARFADREKQHHNIFFAVHTLVEERVWDPEKMNFKTKELGAWSVRTQSNSKAVKCFFFDLDVGNDDRKYASQADALADLIKFCKATKLPRPLVTSSGGGLHVYWVFDTAIPSAEWRTHAFKLRKLAEHHGLKVDPSRTTDSASVLRVVGTQNLKDQQNPRPVVALTPCTTRPVQDYVRLIQDAIISADITDNPPPAFPQDDILGNNTAATYDGPPTSIQAMAAVCAQVQHVIRSKGNLSYPAWFHGTLQLFRHLEDGRKWAHRISSGYPGYTFDETDGVLDQLELKGIGPTSCAKMAEVCGESRCEGCVFRGKVKSPISAARYKDPAPQAQVQFTLNGKTVTTVIPDPPAPYTRTKSGIAISKTDKEGDVHHVFIYENDLYPLLRTVNETAACEQQIWRVELPRTGAKDFILDADALYDKKKFVTTVSNLGIYPQREQVEELQNYMIAYIAELQRAMDAEAQCNHLGWTKDHEAFILPDKLIYADGTVKPARLSVGAQRAAGQILKAGDPHRQIELLNFYNHRAYVPQQFFVVAGLAAPLFYATGHHGVVVNASGDPGASKSTALYTAASFWGQPELYPINGTNNGATVRGRNERISTLANLPICVDEITHMPISDAIDLAMGVTQPGHRIRLEPNGVERATVESHKATMMLTTANNSLHSALSMDNAAGTAGSMRVFEIRFTAGMIHKKFEADEFIRHLKENFGHLGEVFIAHITCNRKAVEQRVHEMMRIVDERAHIQSGERFWSATVATIVVTCEIANELGLLSYSAADLLEWAIEVQIPQMRGVITEEYSSPVGILAEYLQSINGETIVTRKGANGGNIPNVLVTPRGKLMAHYDVEEQVLWVLKKGFKDYCTKQGANMAKILSDLSVPKTNKAGNPQRIIANTRIKKVLGAGTEWAKAQSYCFTIDMSHPEINGVVELGVTSNEKAVLSAPKGELKLV